MPSVINSLITQKWTEKVKTGRPPLDLIFLFPSSIFLSLSVFEFNSLSSSLLIFISSFFWFHIHAFVSSSSPLATSLTSLIFHPFSYLVSRHLLTHIFSSLFSEMFASGSLFIISQCTGLRALYHLAIRVQEFVRIHSLI